MLILELNFMFILSMSTSDIEVHSPAEKVRKLVSRVLGTLPSFPCLPLLCFNSFSLTEHQCLGPAAKQAKDWAGHCILSLSVNKICNNELLYEAATEFRLLIRPEKQSCLAWTETNQNRELKFSQGCYLDSLWLTQKLKNPVCRWGAEGLI